MKSRSFQLDENVLNAMDNYVEENNISSANVLIESLLEKFLYENDYIRYDVEEVVKTPADIKLERKDKFRFRSHGEKWVGLFYEDYDFGRFKRTEVDKVIDKMMCFSDNELKELSMDNWDYDIRKHKSYVRMKLDNPLLTVDEFFKLDSLSVRNDVKMFYVWYKGQMIAGFNKNNYSKDDVDDVYNFLAGLSDEELMGLVDDRKKSDLNSDKFVLKFIRDKKYGVAGKMKPYTTVGYKGNIIFQRRGFVFGTHSPDMVDKVWDFLNSKGWDSFYSTKVQNLKGNEYKEWLYGEMDKVGMS